MIGEQEKRNFLRKQDLSSIGHGSPPPTFSSLKRMKSKIHLQENNTRPWKKQLWGGKDYAANTHANQEHEWVCQIAKQFRNLCYLLGDRTTGECMVVDGAFDVHSIAMHVLTESLEITSVFLTHSHFDHAGGPPLQPFEELGRKFNLVMQGVKNWLASGATVYVHEADYDDVVHNCGLSGRELDNLVKTKEGDKITVGPESKFEYTVMATPGHTPGSQCLHDTVHKELYVGDLVFARCCGRVDLPGADTKAMFDSIMRIKELDPETVVWPGHDYNGSKLSIGKMCKINSAFQKASFEQLEPSKDHDTMKDLFEKPEFKFALSIAEAIPAQQAGVIAVNMEEMYNEYVKQHGDVGKMMQAYILNTVKSVDDEILVGVFTVLKVQVTVMEIRKTLYWTGLSEISVWLFGFVMYCVTRSHHPSEDVFWAFIFHVPRGILGFKVFSLLVKLETTLIRSLKKHGDFNYLVEKMKDDMGWFKAYLGLTIACLLGDFIALIVLCYDLVSVDDDLGELFMMSLLVFFLSCDLSLLLSLPLYLNRMPSSLQKQWKEKFLKGCCGQCCPFWTCCCCLLDEDNEAEERKEENSDLESGPNATHIELCQEVTGNASNLEGKVTGNLPGVTNSPQGQQPASSRL